MGDFRSLRVLCEQLAELATPSVRAELSRDLGEEAMKLLDDEFRDSRDPYGSAWKPISSRSGQPLRDTATHLQNSLHYQADEHGFAISTAWEGAAVHQYGATIVPKNGKALVFRVRGAPTASNARGKPSDLIFARKVTIPARQYIPEDEIGPIWGPALERSADEFMHRRFPEAHRRSA